MRKQNFIKVYSFLQSLFHRLYSEIKKNKFHIYKYLTLTILAGGIVCLYTYFPLEDQKIQIIQNNLIIVSGILSGIVIAYLSVKHFQIIQRREERQRNINHLSDKLTCYRKILYRVMKSDNFWISYSDIEKLKRKYPGISFSKIHDHSEKNQDLSSKFWLDEKEISITTADLYLAMEEITGPLEREDGWAYDKLHSYNYSLDYLSKIHMPSNQIWYYLEYKYAKHTEGLIDDKKIWILFQDDVRELASQINPKFKDVDFDRHLIAQLGTDFHELYIPRLLEMTKRNQQGLSKSIIYLLVALIVVLFSGVLVPLTFQIINIPPFLERILTFSIVVTVIIGITSFIFDFSRMLNREVKLKE